MLVLDKNSRVMQFLAPTQQLDAGVYYPSGGIHFSPITDGVVSYDGESDITIFQGETLAVPRGVILMDVSVDFRVGGTLSDRPLSIPRIKRNPTSQLYDEGDTVTLQASVDANATDLQWFKDGVWVSGENSNTLTIANAQESDGGVYFLRVGNWKGHVDTTSVRIAMRFEAFDVTVEYKDFSQSQIGNAMRAGYHAAAHAGNAGDCVPPAFTIGADAYDILEISGDEATNQVRFRVDRYEDFAGRQLRLMTANVGIMATLTYNEQTEGFIGTNSEMTEYLLRNDGNTVELSIAFIG
ncbi:immunoglobulin domain-containing protein [Vibrio astriarenae]|uniref:immunoglobulin domain-containing protein n=1 Tax=Vibrio astriarenae TaxID=1481923 RepID=UPI003735CA90